MDGFRKERIVRKEKIIRMKADRLPPEFCCGSLFSYIAIFSSLHYSIVKRYSILLNS